MNYEWIGKTIKKKNLIQNIEKNLSKNRKKKQSKISSKNQSELAACEQKFTREKRIFVQRPFSHSAKIRVQKFTPQNHSRLCIN